MPDTLIMRAESVIVTKGNFALSLRHPVQTAVGRKRTAADQLKHRASHVTRAFDEDLPYRFSTRAIHAGQRPDPTTGGITPPIVQTSPYVQDGLGGNKGYESAPGKNPPREALEGTGAALGGGRH